MVHLRPKQFFRKKTFPAHEYSVSGAWPGWGLVIPFPLRRHSCPHGLRACLRGRASNRTPGSVLAVRGRGEEPSTARRGEGDSPKVTRAGPGGQARGAPGNWRRRRVLEVDGHPSPSLCKSGMTLMAPSPEFGAPSLKSASRPGRPRGPFPCAPPANALTCWPFKTPPPPPPPTSPAPLNALPPELHQARARPRPVGAPLTPQPGRCSEESEARGGVRGGAARLCARAPAAFARPSPRAGLGGRVPAAPSPPLARRVARRAPARRLPRIAWSPRLAAPLPRPSILLQPPSREARAAPAAGGREGRDEKPAGLGVGAPCEERAGGDARRGGLDRRVGGLPPPPRPASGPRIYGGCIRPRGGPRLA